MFLLHLGVHDDIIQVDEHMQQVKLTKAVLHQLLEGGQHIVQAVGHTQKFIDTHSANSESHILVRLLCHLHLPKPVFKIHAGRNDRLPPYSPWSLASLAGEMHLSWS